MIITEKMIRELQRRVDISYEDAEKSLRRAGGNIEMAEMHAKKKTNSFWNRLFREFEKIINATLIYRIRVYKNDDQFINLPILVILLMVLIIGVNKMLLLGVVFIILALLADYNLQINKVKDQEEFRFYKTVNKDEMNKKNESEDIKYETQTTQESKHSEVEKDKSENNDDDYYEVTIDK